MGKRLDLDNVLRNLIGNGNVYFQPPPSLKMHFPCIVYERVRINTEFADNKPYHLQKIYQVTYINTDPDSDLPMQIASLPCCVFEREYTSENKYYNVFRLAY